MSEGIAFDGNNNSNNDSSRSRSRDQSSGRKFKRKRVTYDFEEIDRRSSSTFDPDQLARPDGLPQMHITVNKSSVRDADEDEDGGTGGHRIPKRTTMVSASADHVSTNVVFNDERRTTSDDATDATGSCTFRSLADSNVSTTLRR